MKTEMKKVYVFVRESDGNLSVEVSSKEFDSTYCSDYTNTVSAPVSEMEISIPKINPDEALQILSGVLLETLVKQRDDMRADMIAKLEALDTRITKLTAIEHKG